MFNKYAKIYFFFFFFWRKYGLNQIVRVYMKTFMHKKL